MLLYLMYDAAMNYSETNRHLMSEIAITSHREDANEA